MWVSVHCTVCTYEDKPMAGRGRGFLLEKSYSRDVCKVRGLVAVRRCYADGGGDCYVKL
jgi:hypothetical protein